MGGAAFRVGLKDSVTGPSRRMGSALDGLTRKLKKLESQLGRVGSGASRMGAKIRGAKRELSAFEKSQRSLGARGNGGLGAGFKSLAAGALIAGAAVGGVLTKKLYDLADLAGRSQLAFKNMFGNDVQGQAQLERAMSLADRFGFGIGETIEQVQKFNALGFSAEQSGELVKLGGDMRALGASAEQIRRVFLQLGQIRSKGKLQGEELIVLAENGVNLGLVYERLSKKLKKPVSEIRKMQESGDLPAGAALNSIAESVLITLGKTNLGQAGEEAANNTVGGLVGRIGTKLERGLFDAAKEAEPALTRGLQAIMTGMTSIGQAGGKSPIVVFLESIGSLLERIGPKLPEIADSFSRAFGAVGDLDPKALDAFAARLPQIASEIGTIANGLGQIAKIFSYIGMTPGEAAKANGNGFLGSVLSVLDMTPGEALSKLGNAWLEGAKAIANGPAKAIGQNITEGVANGIISATPAAEDAARNMARSIDSATRSELDIHSPSGVARDLGGEWGDGMAFGMHDSTDVTIGSARQLSRGVVDSSAEALRSMSGNYGGIASGAAESITNNRNRSSISIGEIRIAIDGSKDPHTAGKSVLNSLELELADLLERHIQG
jgi:tape measure domain-containing protein